MSELKDKQYLNSSNYRARIFLHYKYSTNKHSWPQWIFDNINTVPDARVLEIGCGNGLFWKSNAERIPEKWDITLTDFSEGMLKDAESNIGNCSASINYRVMDAENIPYGPESFDIILANHMLYHIKDRPKAFSEILRVLKSDGIFCATTMEQNYMKELSDIVREFRSLPPAEKKINNVIGNFSLENGEEQMKGFFSEIVLQVYENTLVITEAEPFTEYAISLNSISEGRTVIHENEKEKFTGFVREIIKRNGSINISADAGIFICRNR